VLAVASPGSSWMPRELNPPHGPCKSLSPPWNMGTLVVLRTARGIRTHSIARSELAWSTGCLERLGTCVRQAGFEPATPGL
jgi:hypothetical protein